MIANKEEAKRTAGWGRNAAFASAAFTVVLVLVKYSLLDSDIDRLKSIQYGSLLDAVLFICIGIGIWRMSRTAAVGAVVLYFIEIVVALYQRGTAAFTGMEIFWAVLFVAGFIQGLRGTFAYHAFRRAEGIYDSGDGWIWLMPDMKSARTAVKIGVGLCIFIATVSTTAGVYSVGTGQMFEGYGPGVLVDAAVFAVVAWRLWKNSRTWGVIGVILQGFEIIDKLRGHQNTLNGITVLLFLGILNAARGTFVLHRYNQRTAAVARQATEDAMPLSGR